MVSLVVARSVQIAVVEASQTNLACKFRVAMAPVVFAELGEIEIVRAKFHDAMLLEFDRTGRFPISFAHAPNIGAHRISSFAFLACP